jgi:hypothetical protein
MWIQVNCEISTEADDIDEMVKAGYGAAAEVIDHGFDGWVLTYGLRGPGIDDLYGPDGCGRFTGSEFVDLHGNFGTFLEIMRKSVGLENRDWEREVFEVLKHDWKSCSELGLVVTIHGH